MNELMALDIGTGTVIGFLGRRTEEGLKLLARCEVEHDRRAIEEGRVVDVEAAGQTVRQAVDELKKAAKTEINVAHYAVPGRGLKIKELEAALEFEKGREVTAEDVRKLFSRRSSVEKNHAIIDEEVQEKTVDGETVINFEGQHAHRIGARWLVTTLNLQDIQNKKNVLKAAGLVPGRLVLEPRAAVEAAMPDDEFVPRLGLIDFGAGTIDAALLEEGKIRDFCTLPGSGDKLTRKLEQVLLVDFKRAEKIKKKLQAVEEVEYEEMSGDSVEVSRSQMCRWLNPVLSEEIRPLKKWFDERTPELLFLAGGGSQFPGIEKIVSRVLKIDVENIILRPPWASDRVSDPRGLLSSNADYTAYGILLIAAANRGRFCLELTVNGDNMVRLVQGDEYRVSDLTDDLGYKSHDPHPQSAKMFKIEGEWETVKKDQDLSPVVEVNGQKAAADTVLRSGDNVSIMPAEKPEPVEVSASEFLPSRKLLLHWKDKTFELPARLRKNTGEVIYPARELEDGAEYARELFYSREEIIEYLQRRGVRPSGELLWMKNGKFCRDEQFKIGDEVKLLPAVDVEEVGLNRLNNLPASSDRPIPYPLD